MKNNNFPVKMLPYEIEQGINIDFDLCTEIATRYNLHSELIETLKGVLNNVDDAGNVRLGATGKVLAEIRNVLTKADQ